MFGSRLFGARSSIVSVLGSVRQNTMAAHGQDVIGGTGGENEQVGLNVPAINPLNMVAEPCGQNMNGANNGGQAFPVPQGGTPELMRGRRARVDSRSRSSGTRRRTQTPLQRDPSMTATP